MTRAFQRFIAWMRPESDESLLQRYIARRDEAAFSLLVKRYAGLVCSICAKELPRTVDVEDACQATFLILAQRAHAIQKQDALRSWLHGVAIRVSKAIRRRQARLAKRERENAVAVAIASPAEILADTDLQDLVRREVDRLPEQYRVPLQLCYWHGQSREEVAQTLGWSTGQVKGQLERAKRRLKARLDQRGIQFLLPVGFGLTAIGLATIAPAIAVAAGAVTATTSFMSYVLGIGNVVFRTLQATKGLAALAVVAIALGWMPPMPFLPIFPEKPKEEQLNGPTGSSDFDDEMDMEELTCEELMLPRAAPPRE